MLRKIPASTKSMKLAFSLFHLTKEHTITSILWIIKFLFHDPLSYRVRKYNVVTSHIKGFV